MASDLGLHCLPMHFVWVFRLQWFKYHIEMSHSVVRYSGMLKSKKSTWLPETEFHHRDKDVSNGYQYIRTVHRISV